MFDIIQLMKAITAYSVLLFMFLFVCYVWYYIIRSAYIFIVEYLVPLIFGKDDDDTRWD